MCPSRNQRATSLVLDPLLVSSANFRCAKMVRHVPLRLSVTCWNNASGPGEFLGKHEIEPFIAVFDVDRVERGE
jgi:hypothetical protein